MLLRLAFSPGKPRQFRGSLSHERAGLLHLPRGLDEGEITKGRRRHRSNTEKNQAGITKECALPILSPSHRGKEVTLEMPVLAPHFPQLARRSSSPLPPATPCLGRGSVTHISGEGNAVR